MRPAKAIPGGVSVKSVPFRWISYSIADGGSVPSLDAFQRSSVPPQKSPTSIAVRFVGAVGGILSALASSVSGTALLAGPVLPEWSRALTVKVCVEPGAR